MKSTYKDVPQDAPTAVMWKNLGQLVAGVWVNYSLRGFSDELDLDLEAELRHELVPIIEHLKVVPEGFRMVRYADRRFPELLVQFVSVTEEDYWALNRPKGERN